MGRERLEKGKKQQRVKRLGKDMKKKVKKRVKRISEREIVYKKNELNEERGKEKND